MSNLRLKKKKKKTMIPNIDGLSIPNTLQYTNFFFLDEIVAPKIGPYMGL